MECLSDVDIVEILGGAVDPAWWARADDHLDGCPRCRRLLAAVARTDQELPDCPHLIPGQELGRGGMGIVAVADDRRLGRRVAVKRLRSVDADSQRRFEREMLLTARLEHPAIVPIYEAGRLPTGETVYSMRLLPTRTLGDEIEKLDSVDARLALLPIVVTAADAIAYAHEQGVIHRDLKPANIVVGEHGQTYVVDWGLAKLIDDDADLPAAAQAGSNGDDTRAGAIVGTPGYMPPEQASGTPAGARGDVYALGAILYHLLAGVPPYRGTTGDAVVHEVVAGPPPLLAERAPHAPSELVAIVERAMARDPSARYPTASELADDLRRFQTGRLVGAHRYSLGQLARRWLKRHRPAVSVGAIGFAILAIVAVVSIRRILDEESRAEAERWFAELHRHEAEELMDFMLVDLKAKLEPLGRLDLLEAIAKQATGYYHRRPDLLSDEERHKRAMAIRDLGDVLLAQGNTTAALAEFRAALDIDQALAAHDPSNAVWQDDLAASHNRIGKVHRARGELAAATAEFRTELSIAEQVAARAPNDPHALPIVSRAHLFLGEALLEQGDASAAVEQERSSLAILVKIAARTPTDAEVQRNLSVAHEKIGIALAKQGDTASALAEYRAALELRKKLAAEDPGDASRKLDLSAIHLQLGDALRTRDAHPEALAEYRAALPVADSLATADPSDTRVQLEVSIIHERIGSVFEDQHDATAALAEYRSALASAQTLAARDPSNAGWQRHLSAIRDRLGALLLERHEIDAALVQFRADLADTARMAARNPSEAGWQRDLAVSHSRVADALRAIGNMTEALAEYRVALDLAEKLQTQHPSDADLKETVASLRDAVETCCR